MSRVEIPDISAGRFIQVRIEDKHYIFGGDRKEPYGDILKKALDKRGVEYNTKNSIKQIPMPSGDFYQAYGAGEFQRLSNGNVVIWSPSRNNGVGFDTQKLESLSKDLEGGNFIFQEDFEKFVGGVSDE